MNNSTVNTSVWGDVIIPEQPMLEGDIDAKLCVVGGGGSGLAAMEEALRDHNVTAVLLEGGRIANAAAGRNGGLLLAGPAPFPSEAVRDLGDEPLRMIYQMTLDQIESMLEDAPGSVRKTGSFRIEDESGQADCVAHMNVLRRNGFQAEPYEGSEGKGLFLPQDAVFHPVEYCRRSLERVLSAGGHVFENTRATKIRSGEVHTPKGIVRCEHVLVAIDGKLEVLFPELRPAVETHRLQMVGTAVEKRRQMPIPAYSRNGFDYVQRLPDGRFIAGGGRDLHALQEKTSDDQPTQAVQDFIIRKLRTLGVTATVTHQWAASVGFTETGFPVAREMAKNVIAVGGYSGTGNLLGRLIVKAALDALFRDQWRDLNLLTGKYRRKTARH